jgi:hypothetical protein
MHTFKNHYQKSYEYEQRSRYCELAARIPVWANIFSSPKRTDRLWGPPSIIFNGFRASLPGVKWFGRGVNHSLLSSAEVKNEWSYTSTPPICLNDADKKKTLAMLLLTANSTDQAVRSYHFETRTNYRQDWASRAVDLASFSKRIPEKYPETGHDCLTLFQASTAV